MTNNRWVISLATVAILLTMCGGVSAADRDQRTEIPAAVQRKVSYAKDVQPLLAARCGSCHLNGKKSGGFRMDSRELFLAGGDSGAVVAVGNSAESRIVQLVAALRPDERMPPQGPILSNEHVGILRAWIDQGVKWESGGAASKLPKDFTAAEAEAAGLCPVQKVPSKLVYHTSVGDQTYHFCCPDCKKEFVANPAKYGVTPPMVAVANPSKPSPLRKSAKLSAPALAQVIDTHVDRLLVEKKIPASPRADDAEFLRRLCLDLHGVIPSAEKVTAFLDSRDAAKRLQALEELLADPQYGRHMADVWDYLLLPRTTPGCEPAVAPMTGFLAKRFQDNVAWNQVVRDILTSTGTQKENGAVTYFLAHRTTPMVVDSATRVFLGMPMECAQCHDHPYSRWEQTDYWGFASFFNGMTRGGIDKTGIINPDATRGLEEKASRFQANIPPPTAERKAAKGTQTKVRLLGEVPMLANSKDDTRMMRPLAAKWLTSPENPYFARATVNRVWWHFFGRGLVNPVDDMFKTEATATHPELLEELSAQFVASGFDVKHLIRAITSCQAYQRTSKPLKENERDREIYSHMTFRVMTPEQMWDSLVRVFGREPAMPAGKLGRPLLVLRDGMPTTPRGEFVRTFLVEGSATTDFSQGIPHALRLLNGLQFNNMDEVADRIAKTSDDPKKVVEAFYLTTLSRRPTAQETAFMTGYVERRDNRKAAFQDVLWALVKSSEFVMNH